MSEYDNTGTPIPGVGDKGPNPNPPEWAMEAARKFATSSDTHDNGREEQWRKGEVWPTSVGNWAVLVVKSSQPSSEQVRGPEWAIDAILAARAQAGLAQRWFDRQRVYRYPAAELWDKDYVSCPTCGLLDWPKSGNLDDAVHKDDCLWVATRDALTAGPTAAAE